MCGIVGYLGKGDAYPALIKGLKRLEYRGYDSAGVALIGNDGSLNCSYTLGYPWRAFSCKCSPALFL